MRGFVVYIIGLAAALLILRERGWRMRLWAACIFLLSGVLGLKALNLNNISTTYVLFPVFAGLFGLSGILYSLKHEPRSVPQQEHARVKIDGEVLRGGLLGAVGGMLVGLLPAMSPSQIGILMSEVFGSSTRGFLISVSAINTSDTIYSLVALYTIHNPRSGVAVLIGRILELDPKLLTLFIGVFCLTAFVATTLQIEIGRRAMKFIERLDYRILSACVLIFVIFLIYILTGWFGLLITLVATAIGLLPILSGVSRTHLMGVLLIPTITYFIGLR
jgi:putative membrane protein